MQQPKNKVAKIKERVQRYCEKLLAKDARITEVVLIGSMANGGFNEESDIDLVRVFDPDFEHSLEGYSRIAELLEECGYEIEDHPVNLGFITEDSEIFMGCGLVSGYIGDYLVLATRSDTQNC